MSVPTFSVCGVQTAAEVSQNAFHNISDDWPTEQPHQRADAGEVAVPTSYARWCHSVRWDLGFCPGPVAAVQAQLFLPPAPLSGFHGMLSYSFDARGDRPLGDVARRAFWKSLATVPSAMLGIAPFERGLPAWPHGLKTWCAAYVEQYRTLPDNRHDGERCTESRAPAESPRRFATCLNAMLAERST